MHNVRYLAQEDAAILSRLAEKLLRLREVRYNPAEELLALLATAILVPQNDTRRDFVCLNSSVTYRVVGEEGLRQLGIVCPSDVNAAVACVSVLAPLPLALLGRQVGSVVELAPAGEGRRLIEIVGVDPSGLESGQQAALPAMV